MFVPFLSTRSPERRALQKRAGGRGGSGSGSSGGGGTNGGLDGGTNGGLDGGTDGGLGAGGNGLGSGPSGSDTLITSQTIVIGGSARQASTTSLGSNIVSVIPPGQLFGGRSMGGGTRDAVYGTGHVGFNEANRECLWIDEELSYNRTYGSGYPGEARSGTAGRGFPFFFWPVTFGFRSGTPRFAWGRDEQHLLADLTTVKSIVPSVLDRCGNVLDATLPQTVTQANNTDPATASSPQPEQVVQYYRASSLALGIDGYNNTAVLLNTEGDGDALDKPLPQSTDWDLLRCLNLTIGSRVLLVDDSDGPPPGTGEARNWAGGNGDLSVAASTVLLVLTLVTDRNLGSTTTTTTLATPFRTMATPNAGLGEHHPHALTTSLNGLSPVNRLPVETLLHIFTIHSALLMRAPGASQKRRSLARVRIAHVCRRWRVIALEENKLWSNLLFVTPEIMDLMVSRAGSAPLTVTLEQIDSTWRAQALSDILSRYLHRVCSLEIRDISYAQPDFLHLLTTPAPALEKLVLRRKYSGSQIPYRLLDRGNAPVLKHLEILNFYIPLYDLLPIVPTLTYLHLGSRYSSSQGPHAGTLLKSLKQLPLLESLILENYIPTDNYPPKAADNPVEWFSLKTLTLRAKAAPIHRLLALIRIPRASLELVFTDRVGDEATAAQTVSLIAKARVIQDRLPLRELATRHIWPERYTSVLEFNFDRDATGVVSDPRISVACVEAVHHSLAFWLPAFEEAFVEISTAHSIRMESPHWGFPRHQWKTLGEKMIHAETITFSPSGTPGDLFIVLDEGSKGALPLFPSLSSLTAECGHILGRDREALANALHNRPDSHRVGTLRVTYSDNKVSRVNISALEETVTGLKVEWVNEGDKGNDGSDELDD